eukprot:CAMPEP_0197040140 /NCGR_PEP_ID=MMETSP1384-20130603/16888_1 /TAXON_ID=29189 /ORGANISM="Ammonia sp." /LENGTH=437 /DNA_ID=CAMNT_0042470845 /DNA_START=30 /DNA_END=1343 /DNA_ORIENTATION=-
MNLGPARKNKRTTAPASNVNSFDDQGFYTADNYHDGTYDDYNGQTNEDGQYYDEPQQGQVDANYIQDANYTDDWNTNEEDYYPNPKHTQPQPKFVRPRPKQKTAALPATRQKRATSSSSFKPAFHPINPAETQPQQTHTSSRVQPTATTAGSFTNNFQQLAAAGLTAAATSGLVGSSMGTVGGDMLNNFVHSTPFLENINPSVFSLAYYKYYFRVHNEYVLKKLMRLLLPFLNLSVSDWKRQKLDAQYDDNIAFKSYPYQPPTHDINAPDGYVPLMAVVTYIVIMAFVVGTHSTDTFSPQILIATGSSAFVMLIIEVLLMKIGFYLIGSVAVPPYWLDIVCYTGYKLVFVTINLVINLIFPSLILYYVISITTGTIAAIFMIQTLRPYFRDLSQFASGPLSDLSGNNEPKQTRKIFLAIVGVAQIFFIQFLGKYTSV